MAEMCAGHSPLLRDLRCRNERVKGRGKLNAVWPTLWKAPTKEQRKKNRHSAFAPGVSPFDVAAERAKGTREER